MNENRNRTDLMSESETALIQEIRKRLGNELSPLYDTDFNLRRWLIGWNYDLDLVVPKLKKHAAYRRCLKLDRPVSEFESDPVMLEYYPQCFFDHTTGVDESVLHILCLGKIDCDHIMLSVSAQSYMRTRMYYTEACLRKIMALESMRKRPVGMTHILDVEGTKINSWTFKCVTGPFKDLGYLLQENYCELTDRILVINAGNFIYHLWRLIQPFLAQRTKDKVKILSSDWRTEILEYVSPENLPPQYGGIMKDWRTKLVVPRTIPEECYYKPTPEDELTEMYLKQKYIPRNSSIYELIDVQKIGTKIKWYFKSNATTIFGVFYSPSRLDCRQKIHTDSLEMVYPKFSLFCEIVPEKGEIICDKIGWYCLEFSSTTFLFSQTVNLKVTVVDEDIQLD